MSIDLPDASAAAPHDRSVDLAQVETAFESLCAMQPLAIAYGITDIVDDQNAKLLSVLVLLGLQRVPGDAGPVVMDGDGTTYELRMATRSEGKPLNISTHRHLTQDVLQRYRNVSAWIVAVYEGIDLRTVYTVPPVLLESVFIAWDAPIVERRPLNNPKMPIGLIKQGEVVYRNPHVPEG